MTAPHLKAQAMILAAGRGERMRPLTDTCPKPLLPVRGKPLMQWPLEALARGGFSDVVVNTAWLGEQISATFGGHFRLQPSSILRSQLLNTERPGTGAAIRYSHEGRDFGGALETAGGIVRALPLLDDVFWVLAGDVYSPDFVFAQDAVTRFKASGKLAHLWLVPNPAHNPKGDFGLSPNGLALNLPSDSLQARYTYSTIGLYHRALFAAPFCAIPPGNPQGSKAALAPLLRRAMDQALVGAELYDGPWTDVGTPERLQWLNRQEI
jgi:N-acetyl-alpha-D-muramate 1-phosphate uridylyltransferase